MRSILLSIAGLLAVALLPFGSASAEALAAMEPETQRPTGG